MKLTPGVKEGRRSRFSLEIPMVLRFLIKSRLFTNEELQDLEPAN